jgi:hypothetical protein
MTQNKYGQNDLRKAVAMATARDIESRDENACQEKFQNITVKTKAHMIGYY